MYSELTNKQGIFRINGKRIVVNPVNHKQFVIDFEFAGEAAEVWFRAMRGSAQLSYLQQIAESRERQGTDAYALSQIYQDRYRNRYRGIDAAGKDIRPVWSKSWTDKEDIS